MTDRQGSGASSWLTKIGSWIFGGFGIVAALIGIVVAMIGEPSRAMVLIGAGLLFYFVGTIDRFTEIAGFGLKASLREKIGEADEVLAQVRKLAEITGNNLLVLTSMSGRLSNGATARDRHELLTQIKDVLTKAGSSPNEVRKGIDTLSRTLACDLLASIKDSAHQRYATVESGLNAAVNAKVRPDGEPMSGHDQARYKHQECVNAWKYLNSAWHWPLNDFAKNAQDAFSRMAAVGSDPFTDVIAVLASWDHELKSLAANDDLANPQRWYDQLDNP